MFKQEDSMKTTTKKLGFVCATAMAFALVCPTAVNATEPLDNTAPWGSGGTGYVQNTSNVTHYVGNSDDGTASWGSGTDRQISPTGDVDYAVIECGKVNGLSGVTHGTLTAVDVDYNQAAGDLDIQVFDPTGFYLGGSFGITGSESVN
ncbi:MAG TPA: hypothetical protein VH560_07275, partial [Polyangia bacterium]|nr:hypothetical protein [Polyangia bacterium]